jgi:hypothetical protein
MRRRPASIADDRGDVAGLRQPGSPERLRRSSAIAFVVAAGVLVALMIPETPLRSTVAAHAAKVVEDIGDGFSTPTPADAVPKRAGRDYDDGTR